MLSETRTTEDINDCELNINGYKLERCNSSNRHTGGVVVYIKDSINHSVVLNTSYDDNVWILSVKLWKNIKSGIYSVLYHSPGMSDTQFVNIIDEWIKVYFNYEVFNIVFGDFNLDFLKNEFYCSKMKNVLNFYGLKQIVSEPTRIVKNSRTLIDWAITNYHEINCDVLLTPKIADHSFLKVKLSDQNKLLNNKIKVKCFKNYSKEKLNEKLSEVNWLVFDDKNFDERCEYFVNNIKYAVNQLISYKYVNESTKNNTWFNDELQTLKMNKEDAYTRAVLSNEEDYWNHYVVIKNQYVTKLNCVKNNSIINKLEKCGKNQKLLWKTLKSDLIPSKNVRPKVTQYIEFNGVKETKLNVIVNKFNNYFIDSIVDINNSIDVFDEANNHSLAQAPECNFKFKNVSFANLKLIVNSVDGISDNNISARTLVDAFEIVGEFFMEIVNLSLELGKFPESWKEAIIMPIQKKPRTKKAEEYRGINTLPVYEKVLENVVKGQLLDYINQHKILINEQSGFRKGHSCESALNFVICEWKQFDDIGNITIVLFLDFKRAFETINCEILLSKLHSYGIQGSELEWFKSYLFNRTQKTKMDGEYSSSAINHHGVPQGSVLGPLLFILYINNIKSVLKYCSVKLFADDTLLYISGKDLNDIVIKLNEDIGNMFKWLCVNKLKLNMDKTVFMCLTSKKVNKDDILIKINNECIHRVTETKYLGIFIDEKLNFNSNLNFVSKKISKKINFMYRIKDKLPIKNRIQLYMSMVAPHIEFCSTILFLCNQEQINSLQKLQNRAMRMILNMSRYTHISYMLDTLRWLSIKQRIYFNVLILIYKIVNGFLPSYLKDNLITVGESQNYNLRNANEYVLPFMHKTKNQNNLYVNGLKLYNILPEFIKGLNLFNFKKECAIYIKNNY